MNPLHQELEVKIDAMETILYDFRSWVTSHKPDRYLHIISPDTYYRQGSSVLRHRHSGPGAGELTVKRRTARNSTRCRQEIDLRFDPQTTKDDVVRFLGATGWRSAFTLVKDCHIFYVPDREHFEASPPKTGVSVEIVLYDVVRVDPKDAQLDYALLPVGEPAKRFLEIEIHKADSNHPRAQDILKKWEALARLSLNLGETQRLSLYEIYSGRRYKMMQ